MMRLVQVERDVREEYMTADEMVGTCAVVLRLVDDEAACCGPDPECRLPSLWEEEQNIDNQTNPHRVALLADFK